MADASSSAATDPNHGVMPITASIGWLTTGLRTSTTLPCSAGATMSLFTKVAGSSIETNMAIGKPGHRTGDMPRGLRGLNEVNHGRVH